LGSSVGYRIFQRTRQVYEIPNKLGKIKELATPRGFEPPTLRLGI
jgi:hypothetical protein